MHEVLLLGAGKIGSLVSSLLTSSGDYRVHIGDLDVESVRHRIPGVEVHQLDASSQTQLEALFNQQSFDAVISGLPFYCNPQVVDAAEKFQLCYFDLTEDVEVTRHVIRKSHQLPGDSNVAFVPQCGIAPGFISIVAHDLMQKFDRLESVKMRVGALPVNQNNTLKYSLTWSTDGLINEYGNTCYGVENYQLMELLPLEGYETITIDGVQYEAFNTSGGLGTLADSYAGKLRSMNYKTLRYPGHCDNMRLLMNDLKLNDDRKTLKRILENAVPKTLQDVVIVYVSVLGYRSDNLFEENYLNKIYPQQINDEPWSAIQVSTASGLCGVVDIILNQGEQYRGLVRQEDIPLSQFLENRFARYFRKESG